MVLQHSLVVEFINHLMVITFSQLSSTAPSNLISENFDFASVTEMAAHNTDPNTVYAATRRGVKVTTDGGQTWQVWISYCC